VRASQADGLPLSQPRRRLDVLQTWL